MTLEDAPELAARYLLSLRHGGEPQQELEQRLATLDSRDLARQLAADDGARLAFWIDLYNAAVLRHPADLGDRRERVAHFRRPLVTVAGHRLSLDDIEHGILRRSRWKLGLGFVGNPRRSRFERLHRVVRVDPRVHFALNCGAASCPPIAAYRPEDIEEQLELASATYLASEVRSEANVVHVPAVLLWYIGDFGGPPGLRRLLRHHAIEGWNRPMRFRRYDWTPDGGRWAT